MTDAYPQIVLNEYFCMRLAARVGIDAAPVDLVAGARPMLVIARVSAPDRA